MSISEKIERASIDDLFLDPLNPRLGLTWNDMGYDQETLLKKVMDWTIDEIALSYLENGFWIQEALIVVVEKYQGKMSKIVVEGNRRLAALKYLKKAIDGDLVEKKWQKIIENRKIENTLFTSVPYLIAKSRKDIASYLGFRHVTGIKQWDAEEKARFIAYLHEKEKIDFESIAKRIGSKTPAVKRHYLAYKVLEQIKERIENFPEERLVRRFTPLYMSIDTAGAKRFLKLDTSNQDLQSAVNNIDIENLIFFAKLLFGTKEIEPLITDTRQIPGFGKILENPDSIMYLKNTELPNYNRAIGIAGGIKDQILKDLYSASDYLRNAIAMISDYKDDDDIIKLVKQIKSISSSFETIFKDNLRND